MATYYFKGICYSDEKDQKGTPVDGHITARSNTEAICKTVAAVYAKHGGIGYYDTVEVWNGATGKTTPVSPTRKTGLYNAPVVMHEGKAVWMGPLN